jgi:TPR repeat protein
MQRPSAALILIASLLSFLMVCPMLAGPIEDSTKAYRRGDYKTAYQLIKPQAEKGDAVAQFILGFMYDEGQGVPQDYAEAAKWYRRAAEPGNAAAQSDLGLMDDQGRGVPKDHAGTEKWFRRAAE